MEYKNQSLTKYLDDLSARLAAPGGGSAAALNAAMAASLISMVINFTLGKPKYSKYQTELNQILKKSNQLKDYFLNLVDLDITAYKSKDPRQATDVPLMLSRLSYEAIKLLPQLIKKTNPNLISDLAVAAIFLEASFSAACFNIQINAKILNDSQLTKAINKELRVKVKSVKQLRSKMEERIGKIIRG